MTLENDRGVDGRHPGENQTDQERAFEKLRESPDGRALKGFWRAA